MVVSDQIDEATERRRAAGVAATGLTGSDGSERYDKITRAARDLFDVPLALVNLVDDSTIETISGQPGGDRWVTPFGAAFCEVTVRQARPLIVPNTADDERFRDRSAVVENGIRFYAGIPLSLEDETAVATLCLLDTAPRTLAPEDEHRLQAFGEWAQQTIRGSAERSGRLEQLESSARPGTHGRPSVESARIGGLVIDVLDLPWGDTSGDFHTHATADTLVNASLGDVMGKGESAGAFGALIASTLGRVDPSPRATLATAQDVAHDSLSSAETFATVFHAVMDADTDTVRFVDAGHGLTLHVGRDGTLTRLYSNDLPFGLQEPGEGWNERVVGLAAGEALLSVSDGVLDIFDGTLVGLDDLAHELRASSDVIDFFTRVQRRANENPPTDDITVLVVSRPSIGG
jgi:hypothetical protein